MEAGRIINTHGIAGEVKFEHWCDSADVLKNVKVMYSDPEGKRPLNVSSVRMQNKFLLIRFAEIHDMNEAMRWKQKILYVSRDDIKVPEGSVFIEDLIGLPVTDDATGRRYGFISDVFNRGAGDIYEIKDGEKTYLFPAVSEFIVSADVESEIRIKPPKGIFDEDYNEDKGENGSDETE